MYVSLISLIFPELFHIMVVKRIIKIDYRQRSKQRAPNSVSEDKFIFLLPHWTVDSKSKDVVQ